MTRHGKARCQGRHPRAGAGRQELDQPTNDVGGNVAMVVTPPRISILDPAPAPRGITRRLSRLMVILSLMIVTFLVLAALTLLVASDDRAG